MSFRRAAGQKPIAATPVARDGWVEDAYGPRATSLVMALPALMKAAIAEASQPATSEWATDTPGRSGRHRDLLLDNLKDLRALLLEVDVHADLMDRDRHLRAALSTAIGAAASLALASRSQPTAAYLVLVRAAVDGVLTAAGRPALD